jgi:hypothetical protein
VEAGAGTPDYWRGRVDERLKAGSRRFDALEGDQAKIERKVGELEVELSVVKTKVAFYSAIGSVVGGGIVTVVIAFAGKAFS